MYLASFIKITKNLHILYYVGTTLCIQPKYITSNMQGLNSINATLNLKYFFHIYKNK